MKYAIAGSALVALSAAVPQQHGNPNGGNGASNGNWNGQSSLLANLPSCVSSCRKNDADWSSYNSLCDNTSTLNTLNSCVDSSSCSSSEKSDVKQAIAQLCANAGATITAAPFASYSVTSGGSAWPTAWTTNSAWASAVSAWNGNGSSSGGKGPGAVGWGPGGGYGPFGHGGPGGNGWGKGPWASSGAWTSGPWTSWWGTNGCPASTWSGWTDGPWSTDAPWTTWSGCAATTTASSVYTTTVSNTLSSGGASITSVGTSYGIKVAQATNDLTSSGSSSTGTATATDSGAKATNMAFVGSAAGVIGVVAGAILL